MNPSHFAGVIEGFYGRPWNARQRHQVFRWMKDWGLNTYVYAPKDDLKHRLLWREWYAEMEAAELSALIRDAQRNGIRFVYSIAPGADMGYASPADIHALEAKLSQLISFGCRNFALLFDDIPHGMRNEDRERFPSLAEAQCHVTNSIEQFIRRQIADAAIFFCPTVYCQRFAAHDPGYLALVGARLSEQIQIFWTGPEIVSVDIDAESIQDLSVVLRRKPVIWDNLFANDYDPRQIFLGPYRGRQADLKKQIAGILINPNCQFEANFVPLRTFAVYMAETSESPEKAYETALREWLPSFAGSVPNPLQPEELSLLIDLFYLPNQFGPRAAQLLRNLDRLKNQTSPPSDGIREQCTSVCRSIVTLFQKLTAMRNRELLHALHPFLWEAQMEASIILEWLEWLPSGSKAPGQFPWPTFVPRAYRNGWVAEAQRLISLPQAN